MLRVIFRRRTRDQYSGMETDDLFSNRVDVPAIETTLRSGGYGGDSGYDQTSLVGVEIEKPEDNPYQKPRGVWIEFADDGKRVVDILHEPKNFVLPDSYVWCEESR